jgi:hypothetical protein
MWCGSVSLLLVATTLVGGTPSAASRKPMRVDTTAPVIDHTPPHSCEPEEPCVIEAQITDDSGVFDPALLFRSAGASTFERAPMVAVAGAPTTFRATLPPGLLAAGPVEYLVEAFDIHGNGPARAGSDAAPLRVVRSVPPATTPSSPTSTLPSPPADTASTPAPTTTAPSGSDAPDAAADAERPSDGGLVVGLIAGGSALALLVAGGIIVALAWQQPATADVVTVTLAAPTPASSSLTRGSNP